MPQCLSPYYLVLCGYMYFPSSLFVSSSVSSFFFPCFSIFCVCPSFVHSCIPSFPLSFPLIVCLSVSVILPFSPGSSFSPLFFSCFSILYVLFLHSRTHSFRLSLFPSFLHICLPSYTPVLRRSFLPSFLS